MEIVMSQLASFAASLPFVGLGFRIRPFAVQVLDRIRKTVLSAFRSILLGRRPGSERETDIPRASGYDLLVMQAREIRGQ
ncbi:hypothetical protein C6366_07840 [Desulfonatronum sp. SC1]|nr:hypothetical protein C6366_07840 [Desulfonatronum sp. SC1]